MDFKLTYMGQIHNLGLNQQMSLSNECLFSSMIHLHRVGYPSTPAFYQEWHIGFLIYQISVNIGFFANIGYRIGYKF